MKTFIEKVQVIAKYTPDIGYSTYVFKRHNFNSYLMCTAFPNWELPTIIIGDIGYIKYREVEAGKDFWYDFEENKMIPYKTTDCHLLQFVPETKNLDLLQNN